MEKANFQPSSKIFAETFAALERGKNHLAASCFQHNQENAVMKSSIIAALLLSVAIHAQPTNPEANTASISGRVTLNGKPAKHVNVTLVPGPYGSPDTPGRQKAKTDDEGRYQFKNLAAGRYGLVAASYINTSAELLELAVKPFKVCTVAAGEELKDFDLALVRGGVITGRITDANHQPVIAMRVKLAYLDAQGKPQAFPFFSTNEEMNATDDRGVYRLFGLPPGRYLVSVGVDVRGGQISQGNVRGFYPLTYFPSVAEEAQATIIEVKAEEEAVNIDIKLPPLEKAYNASGRIVNAETGQPMPGSVYDFGKMQGGRMSLFTAGMPADEQGNFRIVGLTPGQYGVASTDGVGRDYFGDPVTFAISDKDVEGLELKLQRGATINGLAVLEGTSDPAMLAKLTAGFITAENMTYKKMENLRPARTKIQANGRFSFSGLRPGQFRFDLSSELQGLSILRVEHNGAELRDSLEVKQGEQLNNVRVIIATATGLVRGTVNFVGGLLPSGAQVKIELRRAAGHPAARVVDLDSSKRFVLQGIADGEYEILARLLANNNAISSAPQRIRVTNGATTDVTLTLNVR
jgi:protocatechuate 3,4-dioxygenase beta subunit